MQVPRFLHFLPKRIFKPFLSRKGINCHYSRAGRACGRFARWPSLALIARSLVGLSARRRLWEGFAYFRAEMDR